MPPGAEGEREREGVISSIKSSIKTPAKCRNSDYVIIKENDWALSQKLFAKFCSIIKQISPMNTKYY